MMPRPNVSLALQVVPVSAHRAREVSDGRAARVERRCCRVLGVHESDKARAKPDDEPPQIAYWVSNAPVGPVDHPCESVMPVKQKVLRASYRRDTAPLETLRLLSRRTERGNIHAGKACVGAAQSNNSFASGSGSRSTPTGGAAE